VALPAGVCCISLRSNTWLAVENSKLELLLDAQTFVGELNMVVVCGRPSEAEQLLVCSCSRQSNCSSWGNAPELDARELPTKPWKGRADKGVCRLSLVSSGEERPLGDSASSRGVEWGDFRIIMSGDKGGREDMSKRVLSV